MGGLFSREPDGSIGPGSLPVQPVPPGGSLATQRQKFSGAVSGSFVVVGSIQGWTRRQPITVGTASVTLSRLSGSLATICSFATVESTFLFFPYTSTTQRVYLAFLGLIS